MTARLCASALLLVAVATPIQAKSFAWCQVNGSKYEAFLSGVVEIDDGPDAFRTLRTGSFGTGFQKYVSSSLDPGASGIDCNKQDSRLFAEDYIDVLIGANPGYKYVKTGWQGENARPTAAGGQQRRGSSAPRLSPLKYRTKATNGT